MKTCLLLTALLARSAMAGAPIESFKKTVGAESPFDQGRREFQIGVGPFFALNAVSEKRPDITDTDLNLRFGWMLWSPGGSGVLRGNVEFLADVFGAGIVEGPGNVMAGGTLLLRYNFVQPDAKWTPYIQIGAGGLYNDVYESRPQRVLGRAFEFDLQAGVGLRYFVSDTCAVFIEADFRHISNANSAARNLGLNSVGGLIGGSYFF